jgi:hypothetical protein
MSPDGTKLCVAGTMDDYATVGRPHTLQEGPLVTAAKPYWATVSGDGKACVISESGPTRSPRSTFSPTGPERRSLVPVGDHPQRVPASPLCRPRLVPARRQLSPAGAGARQTTSRAPAPL